jgi:hypothetical protein
MARPKIEIVLTADEREELERLSRRARAKRHVALRAKSDVVGLYVNPPDHAVVIAFDEKPQVQALERSQPILPMDLGMPERQTDN